jgi:hypothetical protein
VADMDHERAAADRGAVDPFGGGAHKVCHLTRVDVGGLRAVVGIAHL